MGVGRETTAFENVSHDLNSAYTMGVGRETTAASYIGLDVADSLHDGSR